MHKFVIVSNRLPVSASRVDGKLEFSTSSGGLATAMSSLEASDQIWVGWPGIAEDDLTPAEKSQITRELRKHHCYPVHLTSRQIADFYEGYSNDTLWPLFHYFQAYARFNTRYYAAYKAVNRRFLAAVQKCADPQATIWVQDYQLLLLPGFVRRALPDTRIGFFLHIPFPSYEIFRLIPERRELIEGLMGADLLGFHIYDYARHFLSSANHILGTTSENGVIEYKGRRVQVDTFPIGIDYDKFRATLSEKKTKQEVERLGDRYKNQQILLSVDRLDYSKGILQRLQAYEQFLTDHPEYQKKVTLLIIAVPSRTEVETYKLLRDEIEQAVSRINGLFGTVDWAPISYQFQGLPFNDIVALYAKSDVALVTPLRDGMNLIAKEYIASKRGRKGVLVLSETAGAADELHEAMFVNPNDTKAFAHSIYRALTMPKAEQMRRLKVMQARLSSYTVQRWGQDFVEQLDIAQSSHLGALSKRLTPSDASNIIDSYGDAKARLLLLDYDGTLHGFSNSISADAVRPGAKLRAHLRAIANHPNTRVCIIRGRPRQTLTRWFSDMPNLLLVAEHGAWMRKDGQWQQNAEHIDMSSVRDLLHSYASRTPGSIVEEKDFATVWHYRRVNPELAYMRNSSLKRELTQLVEGTELAIYAGNKIIEIKPRTIHKGEIIKLLQTEYPSDFVFCAGDDYTDEHMFESLPIQAHTVKVGFGSTHAHHQVDTLDRVLNLVERMSRAMPNRDTN